MVITVIFHSKPDDFLPENDHGVPKSGQRREVRESTDG
jgi:hypothetical protein